MMEQAAGPDPSLRSPTLIRMALSVPKCSLRTRNGFVDRQRWGNFLRKNSVVNCEKMCCGFQIQFHSLVSKNRHLDRLPH